MNIAIVLTVAAIAIATIADWKGSASSTDRAGSATATASPAPSAGRFA